MQKKYLGLDYGRKKIGLAISEGILAEPYKVVRFVNKGKAVKDIKLISEKEGINQIVLGISEGRMAEETKEFGKKLEKIIGTPVVYQDETLSTREAQSLSIKAGIKRKKRKSLEDAFSAALILQSYLDKFVLK